MGCTGPQYTNDTRINQKEDYLTRTIFESIISRQKAQIQNRDDQLEAAEQEREKNLIRQQQLLDSLNIKGPRSYVDNLIITEIPKMEFGNLAAEEDLVKDLNDRDCEELEEQEEVEKSEKNSEEAKNEEKKEELSKKDEKESSKNGNEKNNKKKDKKKEGKEGEKEEKKGEKEGEKEEKKEGKKGKEEKKEDAKDEISEKKEDAKDGKNEKKDGDGGSEVSKEQKSSRQTKNSKNTKNSHNNEKKSNTIQSKNAAEENGEEKLPENEEYSENSQKVSSKKESEKAKKNNAEKYDLKLNKRYQSLMNQKPELPSYISHIKKYKYPEQEKSTKINIEFPSKPQELIFCILGEEKTGKTSFIKKYTRNVFEEISEKTEAIKDYDIETEAYSQKFKIKILDTPPLTKRKYLKTIQEDAINKSHIIFYIVDIGDENAEFKVRLFPQSFIFNYKQIIVVIGNKSDKVSIFSKDNMDKIDEYCYENNYIFYGMSCANTDKEEIEKFINERVFRKYFILFSD